MKRIVVLLSFLSFLSFSSFAEPVSTATAGAVARNWIAKVTQVNSKAITVLDVDPITDGSATLIYVCNLSPKGFVLVAGDDVSHPIIMYSTEGSFYDGSRPPGMLMMLEGAKEQLRTAISSSMLAEKGTIHLWDELIHGTWLKETATGSVSPLLDSKWNQTTPYNKFCPADPNGNAGHAFTGCVSLAMAQVMRFHGWPARGIGSFSYIDPANSSKGDPGYGTLSADFGATEYAWYNMPDVLTTTSPASAINATAQLIYHCGVATETDYGPRSSSAYLSKTRSALVNYFYYSPDARYVRRSDFTEPVWIGMLKDDLDNRRVILYGGYDNAEGVGHAFVLDGYDASGLFHINWGWGGAYNGYFNIGSLTPASFNFAAYQDAVINIKTLGWLAQTSAFKRAIFAGKAVDQLTVWACGDGGTILRTTNAGDGWSSLSIPDTTFGLCSIDAVSGTTAWVVGNKGIGGDAGVWNTTSSGSSWTKQLTFQQFGGILRSVRFYDANHGIVQGDPINGEFAIWTTNDGGATWNSVPGTNIPDPIAGEYSNGNSLSLKGNSAWFGTGEKNTGTIRVYLSTDRGATWQSSAVITGLGNLIVSTSFADPSVGWALGVNGNTSRTTDGGKTWGTATPTGAAKGTAIAYVDGPVVGLTGNAGTFQMSADNGSTWTNQNKPSTAVQLNALTFPSGEIGWLFGESGIILKWIGTAFFMLPPEAPTLLSPANASVDMTVSPTLVWQPPPRATVYSLQVSTSPSFQTVLIDKQNIRAISYPLGGLSTKTTYYWRVRCGNSGGESNWSSVWSFTTVASLPSPPLLVSPMKGSGNAPLTMQLKWRTSLNASSYRLWVTYVVSGLTTTFLDQSGIPDTTHAVSGLDHDTKYTWLVKAVNAGGESFWSEAWDFTTVLAPPTAPVLISPPLLSKDISITPSLQWSGGERAAAHQVQLATDVSFSALVHEKDSILKSPYMVPGLAYDTKYFWRVRSKNAGGSSDWSVIWNFTTIQAPPPAPLLRLPVDKAVNQPVSLNFEWENVTGATSYQLQVAVDNMFQGRIVDSTLPGRQCRVTTLAYNREYYWRVRANAASGAGPWSDVWQFRTSIQPPMLPQLISPVDFATDVDTTVTLSWQPSTGADSYRLQVSFIDTFSSLLCDTSGLVIPSCTFPILLPDQTYYWRVEALNAGGSSGWSKTSRFTTRKSLLGIEQSTSIAGYSLYQNYPNPFSASAGQTATTIVYELPQGAFVTLSVLDFYGRKVGELVNRYQSAGAYSAGFNPQQLPAGVYLYRLETGTVIITRMMMMLR